MIIRARRLRRLKVRDVALKWSPSASGATCNTVTKHSYSLYGVFSRLREEFVFTVASRQCTIDDKVRSGGALT